MTSKLNIGDIVICSYYDFAPFRGRIICEAPYNDSSMFDIDEMEYGVEVLDAEAFNDNPDEIEYGVDTHCLVGELTTDTGWWVSACQMKLAQISYDPEQQGDKDDDI